MSARRLLVILALAGGLLAPLAGSPHRRDESIDVHTLARTIAREEDHVTALELAAWIRDRKPGLRVIDLRAPAGREDVRVPRSENLDLETLMRTRFERSETVVLLSDGGAHAAQAWMLLRMRDGAGGPAVYFLRNGVYEWLDEVLNPRQSSDLTRYFGGVATQSPAADPRELARQTRRRGC